MAPIEAQALDLVVASIQCDRSQWTSRQGCELTLTPKGSAPRLSNAQAHARRRPQLLRGKVTVSRSIGAEHGHRISPRSHRWRRTTDAMVNSEDSGSEADDHPPKTTHNIWFWFWQSLSWLGYALVSVVYIPWALAVHFAIGALAIPLFPLCCMQRGRKVFIYAYVIAVLLPGRFIWFNFLIRNRRRGKVWDFEMGRPRPVPLKSRRRLSQDLSPAGKAFQTPSMFLTKLPPEVRLQIYRHLFIGRSTHFHIVQYKIQGSRAKPPSTKIRGYACTREFVGTHSTKCSCILGACGGNNPPHSFDKSCYEDCGGARVAILQTCRLVYTEAVAVLYSQL